jgi:hypothetical protein
MITLKQWMETVDYRITEGSAYYAYGSDTYCLDSWNGDHDGHSFTIVFDTRTQEVYKVEVHDYANKRSYRRLNEDVEHDAEKEAYDNVEFIDLEVDEDWLEKAQAIFVGADYDTRVSVPIDMSDNELLTYMKMAHEKDMTFNQFVEEALRVAINDYNNDPESMIAKAKVWKHEENIL